VMFESTSGPFALYLVVAATKGTDTGAYTFGKLFGRHLMTPRLSPKKTWEGAAGGVLFAIGLTFLVQLIEQASTGTRLLTSTAETLLFAISISIAGQLGDLAESLIKREARTKDASASLPGFGGVLDLLDSLLLAAPVGWFFLELPHF
ncbi:MAG: phosphatidate cytidylyltransferase, partial [bacterium]